MRLSFKRLGEAAASLIRINARRRLSIAFLHNCGLGRPSNELEARSVSELAQVDAPEGQFQSRCHAHAPSRRNGKAEWEIVIRVLLVEDDKELSARLGDTLTTAGFAADVASDGETGCHMGETDAYDAIVLDLGLPQLSGLDVLKKWRSSGRNVPVLILTARSGWVERVKGLNAGADDYLEKPFQAAELVARLRALIRRTYGNPAPLLNHGDIEVDPTAARVTKAGKPIELTAQELRILTYLMHRPDRVVSQSDLLDHIYNVDQVRDPNTIEVYIARLRKKLGSGSIRTIRGLGYRLG